MALGPQEGEVIKINYGENIGNRFVVLYSTIKLLVAKLNRAILGPYEGDDMRIIIIIIIPQKLWTCTKQLLIFF